MRPYLNQNWKQKETQSTNEGIRSLKQISSVWLLVIDMQPAFGCKESPWFVPGYAECAENVASLVESFQNNVLFTRFVPPVNPQGSWRSYYEQHRFALETPNKGLWELDSRWQGRSFIASHRFAKWREAAELIPTNANLVMCGVATDCCVLGTVLEANDDGRRVQLVSDASAAATSDLHNAALAIFADRREQLTVTNTNKVIADRGC